MKKILLLPFLIVFLSTSAQINMNQGLQLYLPFNGNANDASGNNNNGVVTGATLTQDQNGAANSAYYFDGVNDGILIPNSSSLNPTIMTVCAKVNMQGFYNGTCYNNVIINKGPDNTNSSVSHYSLRTTATNTNGDCNLQDTTNHNYRFDVNGNGALTMNTINNSPYVNTNQWDCVIGTYDGSTHKIYVNGTLRYQNAVSSKPSNSSPLTIGYHAENIAQFPYWFKGVIDEIRIYDRVLNSSELNYYCQIPFPQAVRDIENNLDIDLTPNPASDIVKLDLNNMKKDGSLMVTSIDGKIVFSKNLKKQSAATIDVSDFAKGVYIFTITSAAQKQSIKFLKQ